VGTSFCTATQEQLLVRLSALLWAQLSAPLWAQPLAPLWVLA
jgi:hypothetical protein